MTPDNSLTRRVSFVETQLREMQRLVRDVERIASMGSPRDVRLGITVSDTGDDPEYPAAPANTFKVKFVDADFPLAVGNQVWAWQARTDPGEAYSAIAINIADKWLPEGTLVMCLWQRGLGDPSEKGEWWIERTYNLCDYTPAEITSDTLKSLSLVSTPTEGVANCASLKAVLVYDRITMEVNSCGLLNVGTLDLNRTLESNAVCIATCDCEYYYYDDDGDDESDMPQYLELVMGSSFANGTATDAADFRDGLLLEYQGFADSFHTWEATTDGCLWIVSVNEAETYANLNAQDIETAGSQGSYTRAGFAGWTGAALLFDQDSSIDNIYTNWPSGVYITDQ